MSFEENMGEIGKKCGFGQQKLRILTANA